MLFNSFEYLIFLPLVLACYWFSPSRFRLAILLLASYAFYMSWRAEYGLLLFCLTLVNFVFGLFLSQNESGARQTEAQLSSPKKGSGEARLSSSKKGSGAEPPGAPPSRRLLFVAAIAANLASLAVFKYTNFFLGSAHSLLALVGQWTHTVLVQPTQESLPIILPLGISFFVFEFIHYLADIYKGQAPIRNPLRFGLFAAFFPSQIAGPIKRFEDFDAQALEEKKFDPRLFQSGIMLIIQGMFKKVALGDNLAALVATGFSNCQQISCTDAWVAVVAFALQIYYDFSGYTDIGRGSANLLGYRLPENFKMPYIACSVAEFWHRWHISLSTWLRDYLYIPLGGSRNGKFAQMRNLMVTMLLGGLWHGASWTFVLWGAYQGLGLVVCHSWDAFAKRISIFQNKNLTLLWDNASRCLTFLFVLFGWVLFRAENLQQFRTICGDMLGFSTVMQSAYDLQLMRMFVESPLPLAFGLYGIFNLALTAAKQRSDAELTRNDPRNLDWWLHAPVSARIVAVAGAACLILGFAPRAAVPFIYFQF